MVDNLAGYGPAQLRFPGRRGVFCGILAVMAVPGVVLLIPKFLVLEELGMFDTYSGMIVPLLCDSVGIMQSTVPIAAVYVVFVVFQRFFLRTQLSSGLK